MKKLTLATMCLTCLSTLFAADYKSENEKYRSMRAEALETHSLNNTELAKLRDLTKKLSKDLMNLALTIEPKLSEIEADKRWEKLTVIMPQLIEKNSKLNKIFVQRKAAYEEIAQILHSLDPKLNEQGKRTWEAKKASQENGGF